MHRSTVVWLSLGVSLIASTAFANIAAVQDRPAALVAPRYATPTTLRVDSEELKFDCRSDGALVCAFEARYHVSNPGTQPSAAVAAFYGIDARDVKITVDGKDASQSLTPAEIDALDRAVSGVAPAAADAPDDVKAAREEELKKGRPYLLREDNTKPVKRWGFSIAAAPASKHEIVVAGTVEPGRRWEPHGYSSSALESRHSTFGRVDRPDVYHLRYLVSPIRTWAGKPPTISVEVRYPDDVKLEDGAGDGGAAARPWTETKEGDVIVARRAVDANDETIDLAFTQEHNRIIKGGLLLGIGGASGDFGGFRTRLAPELAITDWMFAHVAWDTDWKGRHCLAPVLQVAAPGLFFIPSFGFGLGMPVQVKPDTRVGVRVLLDAFFGPIGFATSIDLFPATKHAQDDVFQVTFLGELAL